jgi:hypothetical protein
MTDEDAILRYISDSGGERRAKEPPDVIAKETGQCAIKS